MLSRAHGPLFADKTDDHREKAAENHRHDPEHDKNGAIRRLVDGRSGIDAAGRAGQQWKEDVHVWRDEVQTMRRPDLHTTNQTP